MTLIADYTPKRLLGTGSHGQVWLAAPPARLGLPVDTVAVKVLDAQVREADFAAVADEFERYTQVTSPHLLTYHDVGLAQGRMYLAMEYLDGGSLAEPAAALEPAQRAAAVAAAAHGAHQLHESGIAHREIKPANILLASDGTAKLGDPGVTHLLTPGQTVTGVATRATVEYLEPGIVRGEAAGRASDIWSIGVTLHWALTGANVYGDTPGTDILAVLKHVTGSRPQLHSGLAPPHRDIILRCLMADRAERFATAAEVAQAIEAAPQPTAAA